jgi:cytochrome c2
MIVKRLPVFVIILAVAACGNQKKPDSGRAEDPKKGELLFNSVGCAICHSVSGEKKYGPPLNVIYAKKVTVFRNGNRDTLVTDRQYILRSLQDPGYEKVEGYQKRKMPSLNLSKEDIDYLMDYIIFINEHQSDSAVGTKQNNP